LQGHINAAYLSFAYDNFTTLAVERIQALDLTGDQFAIDADFDVDRHRREAFGVVWEKPMTVTLAIPAKKITHSDAMSITLGAKRRWWRLCWLD